MTSWPEARQIAYAAGIAYAARTVLPAETVELDRAAGRTLAEDLVARSSLPPFDASAMDGWALRGPGPWTVVGRVLAGDEPSPAVLAEGQALEVATGAVVPRGTEGVLPYEQGSSAGAALTGPHPGVRHVRRRGEECAEGEVLLTAGALLTPAAVGLAAAVGHDHLRVRRLPRVACFVTGSELVQQGTPGAGRIRDAVGPLLRPTLASWGALVVTLEHLPDERAALLEALAADVDLIVTSGASSAGPADHLTDVLAALGAEVLVDGVDVKPGHPQLMAGLPAGPLVVGLPGNPLAALAGLVTLVEPVLRAMLGRPQPVPGCAALGETVEGHRTAHRLVPVLRVGDQVVPVGHRGAAMLRGAARAEAFAVVPPGTPTSIGDQVALLALPCPGSP